MKKVKFMNIKTNLKDLIKDAYFEQYAGIADDRSEISNKKPLCYFTKHQWVVIMLSIYSNFIITKGFDSEFAGYVITSLALFVGLLFNFIMTIYNRFNSINFNIYKKCINEELYPIGVRLKNYFKKTTTLSLYAILLSVLCILLMSATLLFNPLSREIDICEFICNIKQTTICTSIKTILIFMYRSITVYFLLDFILITLYIVSSFYDFLTSEYNQIKLS